VEPAYPAIRVRHLWHRFGALDVLSDVTFDVGHGEIFGFIGPNGAGKTTTIRVMATLLEPMRGRVEIDGIDVTIDPEEVRRRIGYMPDHAGVYERITVREYLEFFADAFRVPSLGVVDAVLELTDLVKIQDKIVATMSKGMKQRLQLGRILLHDPKVLILDEPASDLDPRARIEIRDLLLELRGLGKTIFLSSHILTELSDVCTSVGILERGRLVVAGPIGEIAQRLEALRVAEALGHAPPPPPGAPRGPPPPAADGDRAPPQGQGARPRRSRAGGPPGAGRAGHRQVRGGRRTGARDLRGQRREDRRDRPAPRDPRGRGHRGRAGAQRAGADLPRGHAGRHAMSAQTRSMPPPGPASARFFDRARFRVRRWEAQPNPLWIRELRQSARLGRTPVILAVVSVLMTLLIASLGGLVSTEQSPATTGMVVFQTFFSIAYFVVTLVGPAVAANSIASEREGRTWEAVLLTGLPPTTIARGKFLAAFTAIAMYIVMLAPVGALPFLFGGVTAIEVVVAFAGLFLVALLSVAFGLAISSKMASLRAAIVVTLLLAFPLSIAAFWVFGYGLSFAAHRAWPGVAEGPPIWLPSAYERAPFGVGYLVYLVVLPVLSVALPAWFLHEVTIANLTSVTDDRSSGLKRWFALASVALTLAALIPVFTVPAGDRDAVTALGLLGLFSYFGFCVFLFAGDPIGPSRRVSLHWDRRGAGRLRRFLGPGVMRSAWLLLVFGVVGLGGLAVAGVDACAAYAATTGRPEHVDTLVALAGYALSLYVFIVGLGAFLRARATSAGTARVLLFAVLFGLTVGPWVVAAIAGLLGDRSPDRAFLLVASPSPFYVLVVLDALTHPEREIHIVAGAVAVTAWSSLGVLLLVAARGRCAAIVARHEALLAEGDRLLAAEDEAARAVPERVAEEAPQATHEEEVPEPVALP
jgi:ABC-type multidrug transport system ATPase subunit/ABC-type transport system involved in multi-copper enzyme maturation permease subunit